MYSIIIHFCFHLDSPVGSTLLVGCGPTVVVEVAEDKDDTLLVCGSTVVVNMNTLLSSTIVDSEVRAIIYNIMPYT